MKLHEIVMRLVGPVQAVGETNTDAKRLENLKQLTDLVDRLLDEVASASLAATRDEYSMKVIGQYAKRFLNEVHDAWAPQS